MMDEEDIMNGVCADLVSEARYETALLHLFTQRSLGEWVSLSELYQIAGRPADNIKPSLSAAWLTSPTSPDFVVVFFYDEESLWSLTALYNKSRLLEQHQVAATIV